MTAISCEAQSTAPTTSSPASSQPGSAWSAPSTSGPDHGSDLTAQLHDTLAGLQHRRELEAPDVLREFASDHDDPGGSELVRHLPQLYSLAVALEPATADHLVQERYDLNLWIVDSFEGATYLPR